MVMTTQIKCIRHPEVDALVRHLDFGWLCIDCAAKEGYPLALQLKTTQAIETLLEPVMQVEGVQ